MTSRDLRIEDGSGLPAVVVTVTGLGTPASDRIVEEVEAVLDEKFSLVEWSLGRGPEP